MISSALSRLECGQLGIARYTNKDLWWSDSMSYISPLFCNNADLGKMLSCYTVLTSHSRLLMEDMFWSICLLLRTELTLLRCLPLYALFSHF